MDNITHLALGELLGKILRVAGVMLLMLAFLQILMALFPVRSSISSLSQDAKSGRTTEASYFDANGTLTVQWRADLRLKQFAQAITSLPKEQFISSYVSQLDSDLSSGRHSFTMRHNDPSAKWGGVAVLFAPAYVSFVEPLPLRLAVIAVCLAVLARIASRRNSTESKLAWSCLCVCTGVGFLAYLLAADGQLWILRHRARRIQNLLNGSPIIRVAGCSALLAVSATILVSANLL
ncbi:MAG TPA: hypothetical protein VFU74_02920 [Actinocrinis sp.]|nr:hypothetical protein [Actinocrinis sp.]